MVRDDAFQFAIEVAFQEGFEAAADFIFSDEIDRQISQEEKALLTKRRSSILKLVRKRRDDDDV